MCLFWKDDIYWCEFTINGKRYRSTTCTTDKELALKVEAELRVSIKRTGNPGRTQESARRGTLYQAVDGSRHRDKEAFHPDGANSKPAHEPNSQLNVA
jgi:hypothetical protein